MKDNLSPGESLSSTSDDIARYNICQRIDQLYAEIQRELPKSADTLVVPQVLAGLLRKFAPKERALQSYQLTSLISAHVGATMGAAVPSIVELADRIHAAGITRSDPYDFGYADRYGFSCMNTSEKKVIGFETQNFDYVVLLTKDSLVDALNQVLAAEAVRTGQPAPISRMPWKMHLRLFRTKRLKSMPSETVHLDKFFASNFQVDEPGACEALRYGDLRDSGYLASVEQNIWGFWECDMRGAVALGIVDYCWIDLLSAVDTMRTSEE